MIPHELTLSGFLSYREETRIDFSQLEVACVSGANGAGKSSLFDAITWVLFGRARRSDDALINDAAESCRVVLEFDYENNRYRVERVKEKGKSGRLEFQILAGNADWRPLTEAGMRATEDRIRQTLHLDYDTFINSSFFLQGKADMFAQQSPARRKEILSSILGLEVWETYREEANRRRRAEEETLKVQQQLADEILTELAQEQERKERLELLSENLDKTAALREEKEKSWNQAQAQYQQIKSEDEKLGLLASQLEANRDRLGGMQGQVSERQAELEKFEQILEDTEDIENAYQSWQALRRELEDWNALSEKFHHLQASRSEMDARIQTEAARLRQEREQLLQTKQEVEKMGAEQPVFQAELDKDKNKLKQLEEMLAELPDVETQISKAQASSSELLAENRQLKEQMDELESNIKTLEKAGGPKCPLCGQPLNEDHRAELVDQFKARGKTLGDQFRMNSSTLKEYKDELASLDKELKDLRRFQTDFSSLQRLVGQKEQRAQDYRLRLEKWQKKEAPRLLELSGMLEKATFSQPVRVQLRQVDDSIQELAYQPEAHERCRREERDVRVVEEAHRDLERARTKVESLHREISTLRQTCAQLEQEIQAAEKSEAELGAKLETARAGLLDLKQVEEELNDLRREENELRQQVGAAQQMVAVLEKQRRRQAEISDQMRAIKDRIANLRTLELAFGKDGIPALLIEQALPEIEMQANEILDRLSAGSMSVTFMTEREYKDKKREDKRQTLDILISDSSGQREYELFSGGEAFRINFAIRLALSRVLTRRAGARLQTLVIDEGFGSQDAEGRQRLIEAINTVSRDFAKILVITHLDELKDAFSSRIEVQKTQKGSRVEVIP